jgi:GNAT superfamily N-acetyltransferase
VDAKEPETQPLGGYQPTQSGSVLTRRASDEDFGVCIEIAASLPHYFTREVVDEMLPSDLRRFGAIAAEVNRSIEGFLVAYQKTPHIADILWLAVRERAQGKGVGAALLQGAAAAFSAAGVTILEVKTLAPGTSSVGYQATRRFYESCGFEILEIIDPYPGWNHGNPCAIYVKALSLSGTLEG